MKPPKVELMLFGKAVVMRRNLGMLKNILPLDKHDTACQGEASKLSPNLLSC